MSEKNLVTSAEGLTPTKGDKTDDLGSLPGNKPSNTDPTSDTASQPNALKRVISVGRTPQIKKASHTAIETLRPNAEAD